jgi:hypothetical protein
MPLEEEYIVIQIVTVEISCGGSKKRVLAIWYCTDTIFIGELYSMLPDNSQVKHLMLFPGIEQIKIQ